MVKSADMPDDQRKHYLELLKDILHKDYLALLEADITKAFIYSYKEQAESLFQNYLDNAESYVTSRKNPDNNDNSQNAANEEFMKSIEEYIQISGTAADGFRQEVISYLWAKSRKQEAIDYKSYSPLKEAIEKKLISSIKDVSRIITKSRTRDDEQQKRYNEMVEQLISNGYPPESIDPVLRYAASHLWKD